MKLGNRLSILPASDKRGSRGGGSSGGGKGGSSGGKGGGKGGGSSGGKGGGKGGSSSAGKGGSSSRGFSSSSTIKGSRVSSSTNGGGKPRTISKGNIFAGRTVGGANRRNIRGNFAYGSGYGALGGATYYSYSSVRGRNFGYGYWPLYWRPGYYGDDEFGPYDNSSRPGGPQTYTTFSPPSLSASDPPQYAIFGDNSTVAWITGQLQSNCSAVIVANTSMPSGANTTLYPPTSPDLSLQYYRESSFDLIQFIQNVSNTSSVPTIPPPAGSNTTNLPLIYADSVRNLTFQDCVNFTIGNTLPIIQPESSGLSGGAIAGIVIGSIVGALLLCGIFLWGFLTWRSNRRSRIEMDEKL